MTSQREKDFLLDQALNNQIARDALDEELASLLTTASRVHAFLEETPPPPHGLRPGRSAFLTAAAQSSKKHSRKPLIPFLPSSRRLTQALGWIIPLGAVAVMAIFMSTMLLTSNLRGHPELPGENNPQTLTTPVGHPNNTTLKAQDHQKATSEDSEATHNAAQQDSENPSLEDIPNLTKQWERNNSEQASGNTPSTTIDALQVTNGPPTKPQPADNATPPSDGLVLTVMPPGFTPTPPRDARPAIKPSPVISVSITITPSITPDPSQRRRRPPRHPKH